jgi:hypothetical protein
MTFTMNIDIQKIILHIDIDVYQVIHLNLSLKLCHFEKNGLLELSRLTTSMSCCPVFFPQTYPCYMTHMSLINLAIHRKEKNSLLILNK